MRRRTIIIVSVLLVVMLFVAMHTLNVAELLGSLNPHARP